VNSDKASYQQGAFLLYNNMEKLTKDIVQKQAIKAWENNSFVGLICAATGVGKSRIGIMGAELAHEMDGDDVDIVIVAPFTQLLKVTWPEEFTAWGKADLWKKVTPVTYRSLNKLAKKPRSLIIFDEAHHLTRAGAQFFEDNPQARILGLTATPPAITRYTEEDSNVHIINAIMPTVYTVTLAQAVEHGLVADYHVYVVDCFLDNTDKYIKSGSAARPFYTTESTAYLVHNRNIKKAAGMGRQGWLQTLFTKRMHMLYNLRSKTVVAKRILAKLPEEHRIIVFCGSIMQAEEMGIPVYHSGSGTVELLSFKAEEINRLAVVKALDEGHNLPNIDTLVIVQAESVARSTVQRLGRGIRFRPNHKAKVFMLATQNTKDVEWVESALQELDKNKVTHYSSIKLLKA
jgi:superfamily II DNA or RNA helicase